MDKVINRTKAKLKAGELALGLGLRQARTVDIATIALSCGYDWLFIDTEHNSMDIDSACQIAMAAISTGVTPIVRVAGHEHHHCARVLDNGALGVVVPHVEDAKEAQAVADACNYPPLGHRSLAGVLPGLAFASVPAAEATRRMNEETLVIAMLESPRAIDNAEQIAAVAGIEVLLIGAGDLCAEMGIHGDVGNARVVQAFEKVIAACAHHGKYPAIGGVYEPKLMERYISMGNRLVMAGSDLSFMMTGARERAALLRSIKL